MKIPRLFLTGLTLAVFLSGCAAKRAQEPALSLSQADNAATALRTTDSETTSGAAIVTEGVATQHGTTASVPAIAPPRREIAPDKSDRAVDDPVYFDYDSYLLDEEARTHLAEFSRYLKNSAPVRIVIAGHCDERGADSYNIALGERRALSVKDYLAATGFDPLRMDVISYGEERPAVVGEGEAIWAKNRRAEFELLQAE